MAPRLARTGSTRDRGRSAGVCELSDIRSRGPVPAVRHHDRVDWQGALAPRPEHRCRLAGGGHRPGHDIVHPITAVLAVWLGRSVRRIRHRKRQSGVVAIGWHSCRHLPRHERRAAVGITPILRPHGCRPSSVRRRRHRRGAHMEHRWHDRRGTHEHALDIARHRRRIGILRHEPRQFSSCWRTDGTPSGDSQAHGLARSRSRWLRRCGVGLSALRADMYANIPKRRVQHLPLRHLHGWRDAASLSFFPAGPGVRSIRLRLRARAAVFRQQRCGDGSKASPSSPSPSRRRSPCGSPSRIRRYRTAPCKTRSRRRALRIESGLR